tara:strand:+ start:2054 stop:2650 length:597 start_codon:yes stop_codon:yes gene_type:complete
VITLSWFLILKNQELVNTTLGATMDWENEAIPEEDDDKCRKKFLAMWDRAKAHPLYSQSKATVGKENEITTYCSDRDLVTNMSEKLVCELLEGFKALSHDGIFSERENDFVVGNFDKIPFSYGQAVKNELGNYDSEIILTALYLAHKEKDIQGISEISVRCNISPNEAGEYGRWKSKEELIEEYMKTCKEVFGEYYVV